MLNYIKQYILWSFLVLSLGINSTVVARDSKEDLVELFNDYITAWNDRDYKKIGGEIYRPPVYIFDGETTSVFETPDQIADLLRGIRVDLDASGFSHSELRHVGVCELGDNLAFVTFHYSRFNSKGGSVGEEVLSSAYIARKVAQNWRLVAHVVQSEPTDITCTPL